MQDRRNFNNIKKNEKVINPNNNEKRFKTTPNLRPTRIFILDTNVLLHDSDAIFEFKDVVLGIPFVVLQELDTFKKNQGELGRNSREVIRILDELRNKGCLNKGVEISSETGSILKVLPTPAFQPTQEMYGDVVDDLILKTVQNLVKEGFDATLITKDINSRVKADAMGLEAEDYIKEKVSSVEFYKGWIKINLSANELRKITINKLPEILKQKKIKLEKLAPNEFIVVESENNPENYHLFRFLGGTNFILVKNPKIIAHFGARNVQQLMALDLLRDDNVKIISLVGPAGTGKTFLTLLIGLQKVAKEHLYKKFLISRPVVALGADIGYLPGELHEKLRYWMQPVYDNLELIFSQLGEKEIEYLANKKERQALKKHLRDRYIKDRHQEISNVDILQEKGILSMEAITYMRGRSIPYQFILIDEVQNLNPHEVKTVVSRAGEGTKIILAGDPFQIDSPYLDFSSNGLTITTEKLKGQSIFGSVFLEKSERSKVAKLAAKLL
ncbi:PhoH family protein [Candidatus Babeliales bacterium]|nr:PhoH family protein [Candidatus Babeliales bacterium]